MTSKNNATAQNALDGSPAAKIITDVSNQITIHAAYTLTNPTYTAVEYITNDQYEEFPLELDDTHMLLVIITDRPSGQPNGWHIVQE